MIREAIIKELGNRGESIYAFSKRQKFMHWGNMRMWLYSKRLVSIDLAEKVLKFLGLRVTPSNGSSKKKTTKKAQKKTENGALKK